MGVSSSLHRVDDEHVDALRAFLRDADLTLSGLDSLDVRLWVELDSDGAIVGSTGYELSGDGRHVLIRSVAVQANERRSGRGLALAGFALDSARDEGAKTAWLFSRRSGGFWERLGFEPTSTDALAAALPDAHQVVLFAGSGQLAHEVAWKRDL